MRKKIIAANWKMNKTFPEALALIREIKSKLTQLENRKAIVVIAPPYPYLKMVSDELKGVDNVFAASQNCHSKEQGAFTGEVSAAMIRSVGADYTIIGHSERRMYFKEAPVFLKEKVSVALSNNLMPVYCIGETLEQRESGKHFETVKIQLEEGLFFLDKNNFSKIIIAYEPVWAIGTGLNATSTQAQEMHSYIRSVIKEKYENEISEKISILYGGSCNEKNAAELFICKDVDGGLIGGASLNASSFIEIIKQISNQF
jgi:triosephosphate isomerase